ncbi:MAG: hypothetical protein HQK97_09620 [Nitrospirae bacterium]|nr:hypothetical protein [Nitrospirota bacterium]
MDRVVLQERISAAIGQYDYENPEQSPCGLANAERPSAPPVPPEVSTDER